MPRQARVGAETDLWSDEGLRTIVGMRLREGAAIRATSHEAHCAVCLRPSRSVVVGFSGLRKGFRAKDKFLEPDGRAVRSSSSRR